MLAKGGEGTAGKRKKGPEGISRKKGGLNSVTRNKKKGGEVYSRKKRVKKRFCELKGETGGLVGGSAWLIWRGATKGESFL